MGHAQNPGVELELITYLVPRPLARAYLYPTIQGTNLLDPLEKGHAIVNLTRVSVLFHDSLTASGTPCGSVVVLYKQTVS